MTRAVSVWPLLTSKTWHSKSFEQVRWKPIGGGGRAGTARFVPDMSADSHPPLHQNILLYLAA